MGSALSLGLPLTGVQTAHSKSLSCQSGSVPTPEPGIFLFCPASNITVFPKLLMTSTFPTVPQPRKSSASPGMQDATVSCVQGAHQAADDGIYGTHPRWQPLWRHKSFPSSPLLVFQVLHPFSGGLEKSATAQSPEGLPVQCHMVPERRPRDSTILVAWWQSLLIFKLSIFIFWLLSDAFYEFML